MLALKLIAAGFGLLSVILKFGLDYWWRDKRTSEHKRGRNFFLTVVLLSGAWTSTILLVESWRSARAEGEQHRKLNAIDYFSGGGLAPDVHVELYIGPNHPTPARINFNPEFPTNVVVWIENTNTYPIYDVAISMECVNADGTFSETMKTFNNSAKEYAVLKPGETRVEILPAAFKFLKNRPIISFDFYTRTRRGNTKQETRFYMVSNRWEYARRCIDLDNTNVYAKEFSQNYPIDSQGQPIWK